MRYVYQGSSQKVEVIELGEGEGLGIWALGVWSCQRGWKGKSAVQNKHDDNMMMFKFGIVSSFRVFSGSSVISVSIRTVASKERDLDHPRWTNGSLSVVNISHWFIGNMIGSSHG